MQKLSALLCTFSCVFALGGCAPKREVVLVPHSTAGSLSGSNILDALGKNFDVEAAARALDAGANPNERHEQGNTPLMACSFWTQYHVLNGQEERAAEIVRLLLKHGAQINAQNDNGMTALMFAAGWGHNEVTAALLEAKPDLMVRDVRGRTALTWAARHGKENQIVHNLLSRGVEVGLMEALLMRDRKQSLMLALRKEDEATFGPYDETPLMVACEWSYADVALALLNRGANVNDRDKKGETPLSLAIGGRKRELMDFSTPERPKGPIDLERSQIVSVLIARGVDLKQGKPLALAREIRDKRLVELLIRAGAKE